MHGLHRAFRRLLVAIQNSSDTNAKARIAKGFTGLPGRNKGTGAKSAFAVEDTVMFTTLRISPETVTGTAAPHRLPWKVLPCS